MLIKSLKLQLKCHRNLQISSHHSLFSFLRVVRHFYEIWATATDFVKLELSARRKNSNSLLRPVSHLSLSFSRSPSLESSRDSMMLKNPHSLGHSEVILFGCKTSSFGRQFAKVEVSGTSCWLLLSGLFGREEMANTGRNSVQIELIHNAEMAPIN